MTRAVQRASCFLRIKFHFDQTVKEGKKSTTYLYHLVTYDSAHKIGNRLTRNENIDLERENIGGETIEK
jgi:hypothetical protein